MSKPSETWSNLLHSDETARKQEGPTAWDKVASTLAGVGSFAAGFASEQIHQAGQDFVSRALLGETYSPPEAAKEQERDSDKNRDRDKDDGLDR